MKYLACTDAKTLNVGLKVDLDPRRPFVEHVILVLNDSRAGRPFTWGQMRIAQPVRAEVAPALEYFCGRPFQLPAARSREKLPETSEKLDFKGRRSSSAVTVPLGTWLTRLAHSRARPPTGFFARYSFGQYRDHTRHRLVPVFI